ncbi:MAG: Cupin domain protein [Verrucomicrobiaceae bacterium]|nr:Cupin domain protein [Verrucomicrobiaceae bacterium]
MLFIRFPLTVFRFPLDSDFNPSEHEKTEPEQTFSLMSAKRFSVAQLDEITPVPCPCGQARRAFNEPGNTLATVHLTDIHADSRAHYHKVMTEIYIVLEGEGYLEADGERIPLKPMTSVMIKPGCVHRAVGNLRIINVPMPPFDPADEFEV